MNTWISQRQNLLGNILTISLIKESVSDIKYSIISPELSLLTTAVCGVSCNILFLMMKKVRLKEVK